MAFEQPGCSPARLNCGVFGYFLFRHFWWNRGSEEGVADVHLSIMVILSFMFSLSVSVTKRVSGEPCDWMSPRVNDLSLTASSSLVTEALFSFRGSLPRKVDSRSPISQREGEREGGEGAANYATSAAGKFPIERRALSLPSQAALCFLLDALAALPRVVTRT